MWHIEELIKATKAIPLKIERTSFTDISTDSRTIKEGEVFIPLKGERFDGHFFIKEALEKSGGCSLCEIGKKDLVKNLKGTILLVEDTKKSLFDLASYKRKRLSGKVIAITGSNGKTTTKELVVHILKNRKVAYNEKNYNNLIGISKTILSIKNDPELLVFELGTNAKGEIRELAELVIPSISLITQINPAHLQGLEDIKGVLEEKLDLFRYTVEDGVLIYNMDDPLLNSTFFQFPQKKVTCSIGRDAEYTLQILHDLKWEGFLVEIKGNGEKVQLKSRLLGFFNLYNVLFSFAISSILGIDLKEIKEQIETFEPQPHRFQLIKSKKGFFVIDDSYNANPFSVKYAIETFMGLPQNGKKILVLGDMKELGKDSLYHHREIGKFLNKKRDLHILLYGSQVEHTKEEITENPVLLFSTKEKLIDYLKDILREGDSILVKGSRALEMETIVEAIV